MCAPTFRGGAYLAASVFIYRSFLLITSSISCAITGFKMTYLNVPYLEEFMLHLIYFIPLFAASGFAMMGIEECSFNFVFLSSLALTTTLFIRYGAELTYIYAYDWEAFRLKVPSLFLNILLDSIFILILFTYACQELRDPVKKEKAKLLNNRSPSSNFVVEEMDDDQEEERRRERMRRTQNQNLRQKGKTGTAPTSSTTTSKPGTAPGSSSTAPAPINNSNSNVRNEFERKTVKNSNLEAAAAAAKAKKVTYAQQQQQLQANKQMKNKGIGYGGKPGEALHYPITPLDEYSKMKPLPPLPSGTPSEFSELDDISLPPPIPLASPEYDYV